MIGRASTGTAIVVGLISLLAIVSAAYAQESDVAGDVEAAADEAAEEAPTTLVSNLEIARSTPDYPVTPGDTYLLVYSTIEGDVTSSLVVQSDYTINLGIFGSIDGSNKTFLQARSEIERTVADAFPRSSPTVLLQSVGSFQVFVHGAVRQAAHITVWGLTRLSELLAGRLMPYSSRRNVVVTRRSGSGERYDLLQAELTGDSAQDPRLKPGDTVQVSRASFRVELAGEVYRPGSYELEPGDTVSTLVREYGRGATPDADLGRVRIEPTGTDPTVWVDLSAGEEDRGLSHQDSVFVPAASRREPIVYVEGGVGESAESYDVITVPYLEGTTAFEVLLSVREELSPYADLAAIRVKQGGRAETHALDFSSLLNDYDRQADVSLSPFDRIIVPAVQPQVLVYGAVNAPGLQPLAPNQHAGFYVRRAGGFDSERNVRDRFTVYDSEGNRKERTAVIEAGDSIQAHTNSFLYYFNRYFPVIASSLSFAGAVISFANLLSN
jgi:protein involved in polysaccharide export with SLBB domain